MKDINERLRDIVAKAHKKQFKKVIQKIISDIKHRAQTGNSFVEHTFGFFNISGESEKMAVVEALRKRGYNVTLFENKNMFRVDWGCEDVNTI